MASISTSVTDYLAALDANRQTAIEKMRKVIKKNLPKGFVEEMNYGMIGYVVPHKIFPDGYHCDPKQPLPFMNLASQKNFIALYHMGIYADPALLDWFVNAYSSLGIGKLDMGKSCIRFKHIDKIPLDLIGELASKLSPQDWIDLYKKSFRK